MSRFPRLYQAAEWLEGASLPPPEAGPVAVGWSGGADSTALILALASSGYRLHLWHVDHAWHEHSAAQAKMLRDLALVWGFDFTSVRLAAPAGNNREAQARAGRYDAFRSISREQGITLLCLGHHLEDQAETVCMRMLQGAGAGGIAGMKYKVRHDNLMIFRPLLHVGRARLREALLEAGVEWIEDASNGDTTLWRNRLRHRFFPLLKKAGTDPIELFMRWQKQAAKVSERLEAGLLGVELRADQNSCSTDWQQWQKLSPPLRALLLQRMTRQLLGQACVPGRRHIELMEAWMAKGGSGGVDLSRSRLMRKNGKVLLTMAAGKFI